MGSQQCLWAPGRPLGPHESPTEHVLKIALVTKELCLKVFFFYQNPWIDFDLMAMMIIEYKKTKQKCFMNSDLDWTV